MANQQCFAAKRHKEAQRFSLKTTRARAFAQALVVRLQPFGLVVRRLVVQRGLEEVAVGLLLRATNVLVGLDADDAVAVLAEINVLAQATFRTSELFR